VVLEPVAHERAERFGPRAYGRGRARLGEVADDGQRRMTIRHSISDSSCASSTTMWP
jgi:hypothetical protein